ncbi:MAG: hypothetical protein LBU98_00260 [Alistipes sp.]|jgi:hypothetical protein|nr:hypothetical protein [Alistipes sp.]
MKKLLLALTGISAMLLGSCSQEMGGPGGDDLRPIPPNTLRLTVDVNNKGLVASPTTRAVASPDEKTISDLYLLFFEPGADKSGLFVDYVEIDPDDLGTSVNPDGWSGTLDIDMSQSQLDVTAAYNILAIANIGHTNDDAVEYLGEGTTPAAWIAQWAGKTQQEVIAGARALTATGSVGSHQLLMSGITSKAANEFKTEVTLLRNQIRLDVVNNDAGYKLTWASVHNAYGQSKVWNDGSDANPVMDFTSNTTRIRTYTEYDGTITGNRIENEFYVFENIVANVGQNDDFTTCIVVGLTPTGGGPTQYYRVNIAPEKSGQMLYRNHAYVLTVNSVLPGGGASGVTEALRDPDAPDINYIINQWNENEVGTSDQDNNSMLSSPYKTVNLELTTGEIRGRRERGLSPDRFTITTVTALPSVSDLEIKHSEFHVNGSTTEFYTGITVGKVKTGNVWELVFSPVAKLGDAPVNLVDRNGTVTGTHTLDEDDRITGFVTLGYAGLRITVDVVQTDVTPDVLNLYPPAGGRVFAPFKDIVSDDIRIEASGPWRAKLLSEDGAPLAFTDPAATNGGTILDMTAAGATGFNAAVQLKTTSNNPSTTKARTVFLIVSLVREDGVEDINFSRSLQFTQMQKTEIAISPNNATVTFDGTFDNSPAGMADGLAGALAAIPNNDRTTFTVLPGTTGSESTEVQNEWEYRVEAWDTNLGGGAWRAVFYEEANPTHGYTSGAVAGTGALQWFSVDADHPANPADLTAANSLKADVLGKNSSGLTHRARIMIFPKGQNPDGSGVARAYINLVQQSSGMTLVPSNVPAVPKTGDVTAPVGVESDGSLTWRIESIVPKYTVNGRSGVTGAVHHKIEVFKGSDDPATAAAIASVEGDAASAVIADAAYAITEKFKVRFPKIYFPNRNMDIAVTVKIRLYEANGTSPTELSKEITFTQSPLTSTGVWIYAPQTGGYGNAHAGSYNSRYIRYLRANFAYPTTSLAVNSNYMHVNYYGLSRNYNWAEVKTYLNNRDGLLMVIDDELGVPIEVMNNSSTVLREAGYVIARGTPGFAGHGAQVNNGNSKVHRMIVQGVGGATSNISGGHPAMWYDDIRTVVVQKPATAQIIVTTRGEAALVIDPKNNIIYQGEVQVFDTDNGNGLLNNFGEYVEKASMWGSAFTELMIDEPGALPAPWDDYWGANKGIDRLH